MVQLSSELATFDESRVKLIFHALYPFFAVLSSILRTLWQPAYGLLHHYILLKK